MDNIDKNSVAYLQQLMAEDVPGGKDKHWLEDFVREYDRVLTGVLKNMKKL